VQLLSDSIRQMSAHAERSRTLAGKQVHMSLEDDHEYGQHFDQGVQAGRARGHNSEKFDHLRSNQEMVGMFEDAHLEEDARQRNSDNIHMQTYARAEQQHLDAGIGAGDQGASDFTASEVREYLRDLLEATDRIEERIQSAVDDAVKMKTRGDDDDDDDDDDDGAQAMPRPMGVNRGDYADGEKSTSVHVSAHASINVSSNMHHDTPANQDQSDYHEEREAASMCVVSPRTQRANELRHMLLDE
jgi:hypothetical protein